MAQRRVGRRGCDRVVDLEAELEQLLEIGGLHLNGALLVVFGGGLNRAHGVVERPVLGCHLGSR
jgi:uncharacterized membrane protein